jgi:thiol:disulfide interchange protein DsbD
MGAGAGLLSSACVGPIVVSILVGIASNSTEINLLSVGIASAKMTLFGLGVGVPILLLGVFGLTLPKSGKWMVYIQWVFAGLIAYFAYGYLLKGLSGLGFDEQTAVYLLLGAAIFLIGLVNIQSKERARQERILKAGYGLAAVVGLLLMSSLVLSRAIPSGGSTTSSTPAASLIETKGALNWHLDKEAAYREAEKTGKLVFVDFHADWCTNCKAFQEKTQADSALNKALQNAVLYKVYDTSLAFEAYKADPRFPELKVGIPFFLITDAAGNVLYKTSDYTQTEEMILFLE